jgi:hypothetical protein
MKNVKEGWIYVVSSMLNKNYYKIGRSIHPEKRIKELGTVVPGGIRRVFLFKTTDFIWLERELQIFFFEKHINGEWFKLKDEDIEEIERICFTYEDYKTRFPDNPCSGISRNGLIWER